ncbi:VanZ family protein [Alkaliphilus sp. MSJ-5]|uniref:VanZ family protein n=1 Tax=Alkaliphilus flagellatus TaxID=2841507 RepID=A0ABS6G241_9FIRM|nr:VanZ family protein [Alkaliphilus flagellatus]MBU5676536.1 VanZ family protein [Alkaliphilus flagellatus]
MLKNKGQIINVISWTALIFWLVLIFYLSAQPVHQSNGLSKKVTEVIIEKVEIIAPYSNFNISRMNHLVRKNAHFFAYLILGILVMNVLRRSGMKINKGVILSLSFCILYAMSDEFHQLFVPGRGAQVKDVLLDSAGAVVGIGIYLVVKFIVNKAQIRNKSHA